MLLYIYNNISLKKKKLSKYNKENEIFRMR